MLSQVAAWREAGRTTQTLIPPPALTRAASPDSGNRQLEEAAEIYFASYCHSEVYVEKVGEESESGVGGHGDPAYEWETNCSSLQNLSLGAQSIKRGYI